MKILVIGGCGFVGVHLVKKLAEENDVYVLDNFFTGKRTNKIKGVIYFNGESRYIETILPGKAPDIIYHLGEYSRVLPSFTDIERVIEYNAKGTLAVVEYCRKNKVRLIYAGSSTRFGDVESPYSFFKKQNAELIKNYGKWYGLDYAIAYFYNVYGPRQISTGKYATLIGIFEKNRKKRIPHKVNSPGTQKRIFTHVEDVVSGLILIGEKGHGEYCLGSKEEYSVLQIARMFGGEIVMQEAKQGDRTYSKINLSKIEKLGWQARKSLRAYIKTVL